MKIQLPALLGVALASGSAFSADLVITGIMDGSMSGGLPKAIEIYALNDVADLSQCGLGSANNGGGSDGQEMTFSGSITAGSYIYVATETEGFNTFFGFDPDYVDGSAAINGDDAVELFCDSAVIDVFGDIDVDGTGQAWEYTDGWAYREAGTGPDGSTFVLASWSFSGIDALDGESSNAAAATPFPLKTYAEESADSGDDSSTDDSSTDTDDTTDDTTDTTAPCYNCSEIDAVADPDTFDDATYYAAAISSVANGDDADTVKAAINGIISTGTKVLTYSEVWTALTHTDEDPDNSDNVILLYTGRSMSKQSNGSGDQSSDPDNWNREHVWPKSHGFSSDANEAYTDINHLRPADISVNSSRGNLDFDNSDSELAEAPENRIDSDSFEPRDAVKGDVARMMLYMDTRYEGADVTPDLELVDAITSNGDPQLGKLCTLLEWNNSDPVDDFEIARNSAIYTYQGNRNPYIDHPEWVDVVYANAGCDDEEEEVVLDPVGECSADATLISAVQGDSDTSPLVGESVVIEGVVTAVFDQLSGFFVQEEAEDSDSNDATSEGVFVYYQADGDLPAVGAVVRVAGTVAEYYNRTQVAVTDSYKDCGTGSVDAKEVSLPFSSDSGAEQLEGMKVIFTDALTVADTYSLAQYGEVTLSNGRMSVPTNLYAPGSDEQKALAAENALNQITLDDVNSSSYPDTVIYPTGGLSADNTLRHGDQVTGLTGVVDYSYSEYRVLPTSDPTFVAANPRTAEPGIERGNLVVASMNVLNLFNGDGDGEGFPTSRGADSYAEYERQLAKIVQAIVALDADVIGLMELENDGYADTSAIAQLVDALNAATGETTYAYVDAGDALGTDQVTSGLLYKPASVSLNGSALYNDDSVFNRPPLAQVFTLTATNTDFVVAVNHLRSKSCSSSSADADTDLDDGQGCYNATRVAQVEAFLSWLSSDETLAAQQNILMIGDMNSYAKEDPIQTMLDAGYVNLAEEFEGEGAYSYGYSAEFGALDHALATEAFAATAIDTLHWHINADEPRALDYNTENKSDEQLVSFYSADAYRSSDHDPVLISFNLSSADEDTDSSDDDTTDTDETTEESSSGGLVGYPELIFLCLSWLGVAFSRRRSAC